MDRFHTIYSIGRKTSRRIYVVREEINEKTADIQARSSMARTLGKNAKLKEKQKWSNEKLHLENARKLRGIYFIDPEGEEFKKTIKNARKRLETPIVPAMPCKIMKKNCGSGTSNRIKTRLACILEACESTRLRMGESLPNRHEDHIARKGNNSLHQKKIGSQIYSYASKAIKIAAAKAAVDKEWEKLKNISAWNLTKARSKKEVIDEARTKGAKVHFASLMDICHLKNAESEAKHQKYKGRVVFRGDIVKDYSGAYAVFTEQGSSASPNDSSKSHGYYIQVAWLRRTICRCSIRKNPGKNGRCSQIIQKSQIRKSRLLVSSTTTQMA